MTKTYVALFTCGTSRVVHLKLVPNLGIETFTLRLRRFVSRRGLTQLMVSDYAKTFKSAIKTLQFKAIRYTRGEELSGQSISYVIKEIEHNFHMFLNSYRNNCGILRELTIPRSPKLPGLFL